jgi:hypothetical protein
MRTNILLSLILVVVAGCTKPNPNRCCIDEADCAAAGLPVGMTCDDGLICRANVCITDVCDSNAACDVISPYCVNPPDGVCQDICTEDAQCPGNGQAVTDRFCETGACVECRTSSDCSGSTPACSGGKCVACVADDECSSGVCTDLGICAAASDIAYVNVTGAASSDCSATSPCSTIERALAQLPVRLYVLISPGTYTRSGPVVILDRRYLIGRGVPRPTIDRTDDGPIITTQGTADIHVEKLQLSGATALPADAGLPSDGYAIYCKSTGGSPSVTLNDLVVTNNVRGVAARQCKVDISRSLFANMGFGVELTDVVARIDSSSFENAYASLDGGLYTVTNNMFTRTTAGVSLYSEQSGNVIEFNTFVDSPLGCGMQVATSFPNNLFARSGDPSSATCSFPGSIVAPTDITALKLKHADSAPYDYHLLPGSSAIDTAVGTTSLDHDIDGEARPQGAGRDVGADEAQ